MKAKLQLDAKSIQSLLIGNVEKIGFGLVGLLSLFIVYLAVSGIERYQRSPDQLVQEVRRAEREIENSPLKVELTPLAYDELAKKSRVLIKNVPYLTPVAWDPPLWSKRKLRERPQVFPAKNLYGAAELGAVSVVASRAAGDGAKDVISENRLQRWAMITAIVPLKSQEDAYDEALKRSVFYDPKSDYPQYKGYQVQRLEVPGPSETGDLDWSKAKTFNFKTVRKETVSRWATKASDVVAAEHIDDSLTFPLPPLVGRQWGKNATHPDVPIADPSRVQAHAATGAAGGGGTHVGAFGGGGTLLGRNGAARGQNNATRNDSPYDDPDASTPANEPAKDHQDSKASAEPAAFGVRLLRYLDFTVEPGKCYVYRVRLALANPNYIPASTGADAANKNELKPGYLKDPALAETTYLETDWSEPSPIISAPTDTRVLALSVNPLKGIADVMLAKWSRPGFEAYHDFSVVRGQVANFVDSMFTYAAATPKRYKVNYYSNAIAVDYRGGEKLSHRGNSLTAPGEILLLEADGTLSVHSEADDKAAIDQLKAAAVSHAGATTAGTPPPAAAPAANKGLGALEGLAPPRADPKKKAAKAK